MTKRMLAMISAIISVGGLLCSASAAHADELWLGSTFHGVDTPFTLETGERGADIQAGWRGDPIESWSAIGKPSPYVLASVSLDSETNFAAVGLSWKIGDKLYLRPGIGLAIHDGKIPRALPSGRRTDLGSRILFEPEVAVGVQINEQIAAEASWVHISNAQILSGQNPGLDFIGARLVVKLK